MREPTPLPRIGNPATNTLALIGVTTLDDVRQRSLDEVQKLHGVGPKAISILRDAIAAEDAER